MLCPPAGMLPPKWGESGATKLQVLRLDSNALTGPLPEQWSGLSGMRALGLAGNTFTGERPQAHLATGPRGGARRAAQHAAPCLPAGNGLGRAWQATIARVPAAGKRWQDSVGARRGAHPPE